MTLFKGYAQQRGFDPVKIPDPSGEILRQGREQMAGMGNALAANKAAAAKTVSDLKARSQKELENFNINFELKNSLRDVIVKSKWKKFETEIRNEQIRQKNRDRSEQFKADLLKMVPKGLKMLQAANEAKREKIDEFALQMFYVHGIDSNKFNQIREIDDHTFRYSGGIQGIAQELDLKGINEQNLNRLRKGGGYLELKFAELSAMRLGRRMESVYWANFNTKFEIAGQEVDLADTVDAPEMENEVLNRIFKQERDKIGGNWPSVNVWSSSGAYELDQKARAAVRKKLDQKREAKAVDQQFDDEISTLQHQIGRNNGKGRWSGPIGFVSSYYYYAGGEDAPGYRLARARKKMVAAAIHALKNNELDWDDIKGLETLPVKQKGTNKEKPWGQLFEKEWEQIKQAGLVAASKANETAQLGSKFRTAADLDMKDKLETLALEEELTPDSLSKFARVADNKGFKETSKWIVSQIATSQNVDNDNIGNAILQRRFDNNEIVTANEIDSMNMSLSARTTAKKLAEKNNQFLPQKGTDGTEERLKFAIEKELYTIIPKSEAWASSASHKDAALAAFALASGHYRTAIEKENLPHVSTSSKQMSAYKYALGLVTKDIRDKEGDFAKVRGENGYTHKGFAADTTIDRIRTDTVQLRNTLGQDHTLIYKEPIHSKSDIVKTLSQLSKGIRSNIGLRSNFIDSLTGVSHIDQLLGQREYWANKEIEEKGSTTIPKVPEWFIKESRRIEGYVGPETRRLLNYYSEGKVNQALLTSGSGVGYTKPLLNKARDIGRVRSNGNYDALDDSTGQETLNFLLTGSTIREVLEILEKGDGSQVGAYRLTYDQIKNVVDSGAVSYEDLFDTDTQDNLFEQVVKTGNWYTPDNEPEDEQTAFFFEDLTEMLNSDKRSKWNFHAPSYLSKEAFDYLYKTELRYATTG